MLDRKSWTNNEISMLKQLYIEDTAFDEIRNAFPTRTANAIRQKASRLGLRRPVIKSSLIDSQSTIRGSANGDDEVYLFKCIDCGNWIQVNISNNTENHTILCPQCFSVSKYII